MKIVVLDGYTLNPGDLSWDAVAALGDLTVYDRTPPNLVAERAAGAEIVLTNKALIDAATIARLGSLRFVSVLATGYNIVDIAAARERGVPVSNVPEYSTDSVAQFVLAQLLALCHRVEAHSRAAITDGRWASCIDWCFVDTPQVELSGLTMGIVGFGRIGRRVGALAHALGMRVVANSTSRSQTAPYPFEWRDVPALFAEADVVTMHCPLTASNREMVDAALLGRMKPGAFFINTARGPLVKEQDLADALKAGRIAGAACDVVSVEPIRPDNPLLGAPNLLLTPHIAWASKAARVRLMEQTAGNIRAFLDGRPINVVNR